MSGPHPFAGHTGEIVAIEVVMGKLRPRVRLHDMQGHEVFVMRAGDALLLKPKEPTR